MALTVWCLYWHYMLYMVYYRSRSSRKSIDRSQSMMPPVHMKPPAENNTQPNTVGMKPTVKWVWGIILGIPFLTCTHGWVGVCVCVSVRQDHQVVRVVIKRFLIWFVIWSLWCCYCFFEQETLSSLPSWGPSVLVSIGEAAHPTVASMGAWGSKCQNCCPRLANG